MDFGPGGRGGNEWIDRVCADGKTGRDHSDQRDKRGTACRHRSCKRGGGWRSGKGL